MNQIQAKHLAKRVFIYALVMLMVLTSYQPVQMSFAVEGVGFSVSPEYINTDQLPTIVTVTADTSAFTVGSAYPTLINTATEQTQSVSIVDSTATVMKFTVPAGVSAGTYEIRVSDPEGNQGTTTKCYSITSAYEVGQSTITTSAPFESLAKGYDEQESITVSGSYTQFKEGQTTVELLQSNAVIDTASVTDVTDGAGSTQTITFTVGTGLSSGTYDVRFTTGSDVETVTGGLVVRGTPSIVLDTTSVTAGYSQTNVTVTGTSTGFSDATSVQILDSEGAATGKAGSANVTDEDTLGFSVKTGLAAGTYTVRITTGVEMANATFIVYAPSAQIKKQSDSSTLSSIGKYYSAQSLKLIGTNTNFSSGETSVSVFKDSTQVSGAITGTPTVNSSTEVLFTLAAWTSSISTGDLEIKATTGGEESTATLSVVEPSIDLTYNSNAVADDVIANKYKAFTIDIAGTDTFFTSSTDVEVMYSSTDYATGEVYTDAENISFTLDAGLPEGTYTLTIDLDGTGSKVLTSSLVVGPAESIVSVSPSNILRTKSVTKTYTVYGSNTHFTAGTPSVNIDGTESETISNVTVVDATTLTFDLIPSTVDTNGTLDLIVSVNSAVIGEEATLTGGLTATNQGIEASPETYYTLESGNATITVSADLTPSVVQSLELGNVDVIIEGLESGTSITSLSVGGTGITSSDDGSNISFVPPVGTVAGSNTVEVVSASQTHNTTLTVLESSMTLSTVLLEEGYDAFDMTATLKNADVLSAQEPEVRVSGSLMSAADVSVNESAGTVSFPVEAGLAVGSYDLVITWASGDYSGNSLTQTLTVAEEGTVSISISGASSVEIGSSTVLELVTTVDEVSETVTSGVEWASSNEDVATVSSAGTVTGIAAGSATITATFQGEDYTKVIVIPSQTTSSGGGGGGGTGGGSGGTVIGVPVGSGLDLGADVIPNIIDDILSNSDNLPIEDVVRDLAVVRDATVTSLKSGAYDVDEAKAIAESIIEVTEKLLERSESTTTAVTQSASDMSHIVGAYIIREDVSTQEALSWADRVIDQVGSKTLRRPDQTAKQATAVAADVIDNVISKVLKKNIDEAAATAVFKTYMEDVAKTALQLDSAKADSAKLMNRIVKASADIIELSAKVGSEKLTQAQEGTKTVVSVDPNALVLAANTASQKKEELRVMVALNTATDVASQLTPRIGLDLPDTGGDVQLSLGTEAVSGVQRTGAEMQVSLKGAKFIFSNASLGELEVSGVNLEVGDVGSLEQTVYLKNMSIAMRSNISKVDNTKQINLEGYDGLSNKPVLSLDFDDTKIVNSNNANVFVYDEGTAEWTFVKSDVDVARAAVSFTPPHFSVYSVVEYTKSFEDLQAHEEVAAHWAKPYVEAMASRGLTSGISETLFGPDYAITRAEFATLLANALDLNGAYGSAFTDVKPGNWYYETVNREYDAGLVSGVGGGQFEPDAQITREQMAVMITKAYEIMMGTEMKGLETSLTDMDEVSAWAVGAVKAASYQGVISGYVDGSFKPGAFATRAEGIVMLKKLLDLK